MPSETNNVIVVKLLGAPAATLKKIAEINSHSVTDNIVTMSLTPNFDFFKRQALDKVKSKGKIANLTVLNLVFDDSAEAGAEQPPSQIGRDKLSFISPKQLSNLEEFSSFVMTSALPEIPLPEDFWIPVESLLTKREWDVLHLVYQGQSSKKIAAARKLSHRTVELHRQNCTQKLGPITPILLTSLFSNSVLETYSWSNVEPEPAI
jgi:ATP/maltotriose-dependent transcriptional regulator MalT